MQLIKPKTLLLILNSKPTSKCKIDWLTPNKPN